MGLWGLPERWPCTPKLDDLVRTTNVLSEDVCHPVWWMTFEITGEGAIQVDLEERPSPRATVGCQWIGTGVDVDGPGQDLLVLFEEARHPVCDANPLGGIAANSRHQ
jgi:hypothetical protein